VYLPDASRPRREFEEALSDLQADVAWYQAKAGTVLLAGDFNARVGHSGHTGTRADLRVVAPAHGENVCNWQGERLLEFCLNNGLGFRSGQYEDGTGPTFVQREDGSERVCGQSIVDHIIASAPQRMDAAPVPCFSLHGPAGDVEFAAAHFDHRPLLMHCPMGKRAIPRRRQVCVRWRTELLYDAETQAKYQRAVAARLRNSNLASIPELIAVGDHATVDSAACEALDIFESAAAEVIGTRTVVLGITKRHSTPEHRAACQARKAAYARWLSNPTGEAAEALMHRTEAVNRTSREARKARRANAAATCVRLWNEAPNTHAAHQSVARLARTATTSDVAALRHPRTGADCVTADDKLAAFAATYSAIFKAQEPDGPSRRHQYAQDTAAVRTERRSAAPGPDELDAPFTPEEIRRELAATATRKAPGDDHLPAELLKYSGPAGVTALCALFNASFKAERAPSSWRKGTVVSIFKRDDPSDCDNYRPITLLRSMDKLYGRLLTRRLEQFVPLHDQQYAFRAARGTHEALFNLTSILRERVPAGLPTFACFFDARKAYDTVPRDAMLGRLLAKGVTGKMFKAIDQLYQQTANVARVDGVMSDRFPVERGVAQGCPMSPFLYAVFIDSVLDDLYAQCRDDGVSVGNEEWARPFVGQLYADDLATVATSAAGQQRMLGVLKAHSERWGWELCAAKTVPVTFGDAAVRAAAEGDVFWWGDTALHPRASVKYLGVVFRADGSWEDQENAAAQKCLAAYYAWAPVLSSRQLPVELKRQLIQSRITPTATYATELWEPVVRASRSGSAVDDTLHKARRLAAGIHATASERSWARGACVSAAVLQADFRALNEQELCDVAHLRYAEKARAADAAAARLRAHDPESPDFVSVLPARVAPNFMGAAIRSGLSAADPWSQRVDRVRSEVAAASGASSDTQPPAPAPHLSNADINEGVRQSAAARRLRNSGAGPSQPPRSRYGRATGPGVLHGSHSNPVQTVLAPDAPRAQFLRALPEAVLPILALRSAHLPGDHDEEHRHQYYASGWCPLCEASGWDDSESYNISEVEQRWRMVQHHLLFCDGGDAAAQGPLLHELRDDLLDAAAGYPDALAAVRLAFPGASEPDGATPPPEPASVVPFLLDPVAACCAPRSVGLAYCALVSAYILGVAARVVGREWPRARVLALGLPPHSNMRRCLLGPSRSPSRVSLASLPADSDDEAWLRADILPPSATDYQLALFAAQVGAEADARPG